MNTFLYHEERVEKCKPDSERKYYIPSVNPDHPIFSVRHANLREITYALSRHAVGNPKPDRTCQSGKTMPPNLLGIFIIRAICESVDEARATHEDSREEKWDGLEWSAGGILDVDDVMLNQDIGINIV